MAYAKNTKVAIDKSRTEIEQTLTRYGATSFAYFNQASGAIVVFEMSDRRVRFDLPLDAPTDGERESVRKRREQANRSRWRALLLCIKAKLESIDSQIETFEDAFMAHVVMPDGSTVADHVGPRLRDAYASQAMIPLLPAPGGK